MSSSTTDNPTRGSSVSGPFAPSSTPRPISSSPQSKPTPTFSASNVAVIFVLGGPGAGKGTQCARLIAEHNLAHLSAGDLLRAEQARPDSTYGALIDEYIRDGKIVPMEVTVRLLEAAMAERLGVELDHGGDKEKRGDGEKKLENKATTPSRPRPRAFLIDGFPRKMDQAEFFEQAVCPARFVLFYDCPEPELERRLLMRGQTSGRADDNAESIQKRFRTFVETSMPVVERFEQQGRVVRIDATPNPDVVFKTTLEKLKGRVDL